MSKIERNDPCHCGSGKNYKKCCMNADEAHEADLLKSNHKLHANEIDVKKCCF